MILSGCSFLIINFNGLKITIIKKYLFIYYHLFLIICMRNVLINEFELKFWNDKLFIKHKVIYFIY